MAAAVLAVVVVTGHGAEHCAGTHLANTADVRTLLAVGPPPDPAARPLPRPRARGGHRARLARELGEATTDCDRSKGECCAPLPSPTGLLGSRAAGRLLLEEGHQFYKHIEEM